MSSPAKSGKSERKKGMFSRFRPKVVRETGPPQKQQPTTSCQPHTTSSRPRQEPPPTIPSQNTPTTRSSQHTPPTIPSGVPNTPTYGYFYAPMPPSNMSFPSIFENVYTPTFPDQPEAPADYDTLQSEQAINPEVYQQFEPFMHPALMRSSSSSHSHSQRDIGSSSQQQQQQGQGQQAGEPRRQRSSTSQPHEPVAAGNEQESGTSSGDDEEDGQHSNVRNVRNALEEESLAASDDTCFVAEESRIKAGRIMEGGKIYIKPKGKNSFNPPQVAKRMRSEILFENWHGPYMTYQTALREDKNTWWKLFQKKYKWKRSRDWKVRRNYKNKMSKIISDAFYQGRKNHLHDPSAWKLPEFVRAEHAEAILSKMRSDEGYLQRSERARQNARGRTHNPYTHRLGSQPAHIAYAKQQSGSEDIITPIEFYKYTHTDRRTGAINPEALQKVDEMENLRAIMIHTDPHFASMHPIAQEMHIWPSIHGTEGSLNEYRGLGSQAEYFLDKYGNGGTYTSGESSTGTSARRAHQADPALQADINAQIAAQVEAAVRAQAHDIAAQVQQNVQNQMNVQVNQNNPDISAQISRIVAQQMEEMRDQLRTDIYSMVNDVVHKISDSTSGTPRPARKTRDP